MKFLHDIFENPFARRALEQVDIPLWITENLKFAQRPYQVEAFKRYIYLEQEDIEEKPKRPYHLLYNMATGSGKTLIMAGLILHLYQKGFPFFCNERN
ncbi:MAG: DEAD/DEAH box helicase family protein [bacterium]